MDEILFTDSPIVVSAPTGSGKTVLFELAIIRLLEKCQQEEDLLLINKKIIYLAPVKALCTERYNDWECKFRKLGLKAIEVTGDSDEGNLLAIQHFNLVLTTPEKWDSLTRKWRDHTTLVEVINLILIDEVHLLNEEKRGSTLEAVVSRMKTIQESSVTNGNHIRFLAVSATIPNIEDVAAWLGKKNDPAKYYKFGEEMRPVRLNKVVKAYPFKGSMSYFKFDLNLSYKLKQIILDYSEGKPTLIFCSTRKAVLQTSSTLLQNITFHFTPVQKMALEEACQNLVDSKLRDMVKYGVGFHHAGLNISDRHNIEELFKSGFLPILISTSTLAMGVNLPAHLVIIKSTAQYVNGSWEEYSEGQILQMMGRAGRPQFDSSATAIILTKDTMKERYEKLLSGNDIVESSLHKNLAEHLNSEIVLGTITDIAVAVKWLRSTFLYIRALKNPKRYGIPDGLTVPEMETRLQAMCMRELNGLEKYELIKKTDFAYNVEATENGKLMARLYIAFETMKLFMKVKGTETIPELLEMICQCHEFSDIQLRVNERTTLNLLNKSKTNETIRFPLEGRIKSKEMKINCLIQAALGWLQIQDISLSQECTKILRIAERLFKALSLYLWQRNCYEGLASALILTKSIKARMWDNSSYIAQQLPGIGPALASLLVAAKKTSFKSIIESNPRDLERIINKHPPMGNSIQEAARCIPCYSLDLNYREFSKKLYICLKLLNFEKVIDPTHSLSLLVAGSNKELLHKEKIRDGAFIQQKGEMNFTINIPSEMNIEAVIVQIISDKLVGVDIKKVVAIFSKYQFLSHEEAGDFYSDEESLGSSEKISPAVQNKPLKRVPLKKQSCAKQTNGKAQPCQTTRQTNLNQYSFKATKKKFKHTEEYDDTTSENEVSSTQDNISKYNPCPISEFSGGVNVLENELLTNTAFPESVDSEIEKRMRIDMEYKWYIEKKIEISTKTGGNKINKKITCNKHALNGALIQSKLSCGKKSFPEVEKFCSETIISKSNFDKGEVPNLQKDCVLVAQEKRKFAKPQNKDFPNSKSTSQKLSQNAISSCKNGHDNISNSNQSISYCRKPLQLSPERFFKDEKNILQNSNYHNKVKKIFSPLFNPLDKENISTEGIIVNVSNQYKNFSDQEATKYEVNNINEINDLKGNDLVENKLSQKEESSPLHNYHKYSLETESEMNFQTCNSEYEKSDPKLSNKEDMQLYKEININSMNDLNDSEMKNEVYYAQGPEITLSETTKFHCKNIQENDDSSFCQVDDLLCDSPENEEKSAIKKNYNICNKSTKQKSICTKDVRGKNNFSLTFDLRDFTKRKLDFGTKEVDALSIGPADDEDISDDGSNFDHRSLRSDYGDPFAPVHNSVALQRLVDKSKKESFHQENPSFQRIRRKDEFLSQSELENFSQTSTQIIGLDDSESLGYSFEKQYFYNGKQNARELAIDNRTQNQFSASENKYLKVRESQSSSMKNFFPTQKAVDYKKLICYNANSQINKSIEDNFTQPSRNATKNTSSQRMFSQNMHHPVNKVSLDFQALPSPQEIESFKKAKFQHSNFFQKSRNLKKPKSVKSECCLPRLSSLLNAKRGMFKNSSIHCFQSASNLMSPMVTAFRSSPKSVNPSFNQNQGNTHSQESKYYDSLSILAKPTNNLTLAYSPSTQKSSSDFFLTLQQNCSPEPKNNIYQSHTIQQDYFSCSSMESQHNEYDHNIKEIDQQDTLSCPQSSTSQLFEPVILNESAQSSINTVGDEMNAGCFSDENMSSNPSFNGSPEEDVPSSPFSGEYFQNILASASQSTNGNQDPSTFKFDEK